MRENVLFGKWHFGAHCSWVLVLLDQWDKGLWQELEILCGLDSRLRATCRQQVTRQDCQGLVP